jgi:hypothetical protein
MRNINDLIQEERVQQFHFKGMLLAAIFVALAIIFTR